MRVQMLWLLSVKEVRRSCLLCCSTTRRLLLLEVLLILLLFCMFAKATPRSWIELLFSFFFFLLSLLWPFFPLWFAVQRLSSCFADYCPLSAVPFRSVFFFLYHCWYIYIYIYIFELFHLVLLSQVYCFFFFNILLYLLPPFLYLFVVVDFE